MHPILYISLLSYRKFATKVDESLRFMKAIGVDTSSPTFSQVDFYVAHECLLLPYEEALTREDSTTGRFYDCSGHMLWVGERTRQMDGAHLEFVRGIGNPLGVKISDKCSPEELIRIIETMNPHNIPGRLSIIVRMAVWASSRFISSMLALIATLVPMLVVWSDRVSLILVTAAFKVEAISA